MKSGPYSIGNVHTMVAIYWNNKACAIHKILKHLGCCLDANKALGFVLCFISISTACLVVYFMQSIRSSAYRATSMHAWLNSYAEVLVRIKCQLNSIH